MCLEEIFGHPKWPPGVILIKYKSCVLIRNSEIVDRIISQPKWPQVYLFDGSHVRIEMLRPPFFLAWFDFLGSIIEPGLEIDGNYLVN